MKHIIGTKADCDTVAAAADKLCGYPRAGRNAATGELVNPGKAGSFGWTMRHADVVKHPTKAAYAYPVDDKLENALAEPELREKLKAAELAELDAAKLNAAELSKDLEPVETRTIER